MQTAVYDASERPITFDILSWIATVGAMAGGDLVHFIILADRWREKTTKDRSMTPAQKMWRVRRILAQSCDLLPKSMTTVVTDPAVARHWRSADALRPDTFVATTAEQWKAGRDIFCLRPPADALEAIESRFDGAVVLTIRQSDVVPEKNCRLASWLRLAGHARSKGHRVVLIPDTATVVNASPMPSAFEWYPAAAQDVGLRAAIYSRARVCMGMGAGPMHACQYMPGMRYAFFLRHRKLASSSQFRSFEKVWGVKWGEQLPFMTDGQILDYRPDDEDALIETFDKVVT